MFKGIGESLILMENNNGFNDKSFTMKSLRKLITHMRGEGDFAFFPAGNTSYYHNGRLQDPVWSNSLERFSEYSDTVVPMHFSGPKNGLLYKIISRIKPKSRDLALLKELTNKKGKEIILKIGTPITKEQIKEKEEAGKIRKSEGERTLYIRKKCEGLAL